VNTFKLFAITAFLCSAFSAPAQPSTPIKVIENNNAQFKSDSMLSRHEGYTLVNYIVKADGSLGEVTVLFDSEVKPATEKAKKYLSNLEFEAATYQGNAHDAARFFSYTYSTAPTTNSNNNRASKGFVSDYDVIDKLIKAQRLEKAYEHFKELLSHTKNLNEQALFAWLKSQYFYALQDWHNYEEQLQRAYFLRKHLPKEFAVPCIQNLMQLYLYQQDFLNAKRALLALNHVPGVNISEQAQQKAMADIAGLYQQTPTITQSVKLDKNTPKSIGVSRSEVTLKGEGLAQLRCDAYLEPRITLPANITAKPSYGRCNLILSSSQNSDVTITQTGKAVVRF